MHWCQIGLTPGKYIISIDRMLTNWCKKFMGASCEHFYSIDYNYLNTSIITNV